MLSVPDFIIIGAGKSGTTSLHKYLGSHPRLFMSPIKEPRFFALDDLGSYSDLGLDAPESLIMDLERTSVRSVEEYSNIFRGAEPGQLTGEASALYLFSRRAPANIFKYRPTARLIAVLRHPVELAYSAFQMNIRNGYEDAATFEDALPIGKTDSWRWRLYIEQAMHARNLSRFFELFATSQVKIFLYEDLICDPGGVMRDIFKFLGVEQSVKISTSRHENVGWERRISIENTRRIERLFPLQVMDFARHRFPWLARKKVSVHPRVMKKYLPFFLGDIEELQRLIDRDLSLWITGRP